MHDDSECHVSYMARVLISIMMCVCVCAGKKADIVDDLTKRGYDAMSSK